MTISQTLKKAIAASGMNPTQVEKKTGVNRLSVARFLRGQTGLSTFQTDRLAQALGLELRRKES